MKKLTIRLSDELSERLAALARQHQRSVNREVIWQIEEAIRRELAPDTAPATNTKRGVITDEPRSGAEK